MFTLLNYKKFVSVSTLLACLLVLSSCDSNGGNDATIGSLEILGCPEVTPIEFNQAVNSQLSLGDCNLQTLIVEGENIGNGSLIEYWSFEIDSPGLVTITMTSDAIDSVLFLFEPTDDPDNPTVLQLNDDLSETEVNARISRNLNAGSYVVGANAFYGGVGPYMITVSL